MVPKLRFKEFCREWEEKRLGDYFIKITDKNRGKKITNVISNSAKFGLVQQDEYFLKYIANKDNIDKCEYLIPDVLFSTIRDNYATAKVIKTTATWYGVTYKEDAEGVKKALKKLVDENVYPNHLWSE